jgi:hypothetical protein
LSKSKTKKMKKIYFLAAGLFGLTLNLSAQQELIENGSFELGEQGWDFTLATDAYADLGACVADDGENYLWFGDLEESTGFNDLSEEISQSVLLPSNLDFAEFSFRWSGTSDEQDDVNGFDFLYFGLVDENGDVIYSDSISNADLNPALTVDLCDDWYGGVVFTIDAQYAGQNIEVVFASETDGDFATIFRIDNVSLLAFTTTGLSENNISQIQISPNPAAEQIQINNLNNSDSQISIFNSAGKEIYSHSLKSGINTIDISNLTPGFYFVKEQNGAVSKIVKQ